MTFETLTRREHQVIVEMVAGSSNREIGAALGISPRTVENHRASVIRKMGARSATHAAVMYDRAQADRIVEVAA